MKRTQIRSAPPSGGFMQLSNTLRMLWEQHVWWTRSFIISTLSNLPDLDVVTKRLLRNPVDFGAQLRPLYGEEKTRQFEMLFTQHLTIGAALVNAAKAGNKAEVDKQSALWYRNADELATFLASLNPYWSRQQWQKLLNDHLGLTTNELMYRLSGQYAADVVNFDRVEQGALEMADYMAQGISKQFGL